jgi:hypothetical protein
MVAPAKDCAEIALSSFALEEYTTSGVTFDYDSTLGSIMVGGQVREPGYSQEVDTNGVALVATPGENVTFLGWVDADSGKVLSTSASYSYKPTGEEHVKAAFAHKDAAAWFYASNKTYLFNDLTKAATYAASNSNNTIVLASDGALLAGNYTIPAGVTLLIPFFSSRPRSTSATRSPAFTASPAATWAVNPSPFSPTVSTPTCTSTPMPSSLSKP